MKFILFFLFLSCAKVSYVTKQGMGQVSLEWNARSNEKILADKMIDDEVKRKIKLVEKAKAYFYTYFDLPITDIYDETTILNSDAVTYLVIHSPKDKIKAIKTSFPIVGSFPYLGFFSKEDALNYKSKKVAEGYATYMRPVYAYSTLNQWIFDDNILSSFFHYSDENLVELIFHELVHTVFFVKDNVKFNENIAQFISEKLSLEYFKLSNDQIVENESKKNKIKELIMLINTLTTELKELYMKTDNPQSTLVVFNQKTFKPAIKAFCKDNQVRHCWPLRQVWNNARYAAIGTYEGSQNQIEEIYSSRGHTLKVFFNKLITTFENYNGEDKILTFLAKEI